MQIDLASDAAAFEPTPQTMTEIHKSEPPINICRDCNIKNRNMLTKIV